jgi:hypothetical protein
MESRGFFCLSTGLRAENGPRAQNVLQGRGGQPRVACALGVCSRVGLSHAIAKVEVLAPFTDHDGRISVTGLCSQTSWLKSSSGR